MAKVAISQSNYIPWKGYFDVFQLLDVFVVYDDMQFTKRDWRNRNLIKTAAGLKWLSIPVEIKGKYYQSIRETKIADRSWNKSHWDLIRQNYRQAACFKEMAEWIEPLYLNCSYEYLTEINLHFIRAINSFLNINVEIKFSSEFVLHEERTQRLVDICKELHATDYYSGPAAQNYMDESIFAGNSINVHYFDHSGYPGYQQLYPPFEHGVTILDLIFNTGTGSVNYMKYSNRK